MKPSRPGGPFARLIEVDSIPDLGLDVAVEANVEECAAVATAVALPSVAELAAQFSIARRPGGRIRVEGEVTARVTQICVISLDPFEGDIAEPIDVVFAPAASSDRSATAAHVPKRRRRGETLQVPPLVRTAGDDADDPIIDGRIDLGAVAVEFLTLALDFYPRKPGVHFSDVVTGDPGPSQSTFAALERFKDRS